MQDISLRLIRSILDTERELPSSARAALESILETGDAQATVPPPPYLITVSQAAADLGVSRDVFYTILYRAKLAGLDKRFRVPISPESYKINAFAILQLAEGKIDLGWPSVVKENGGISAEKEGSRWL